jgi:thioredoxin 1
MIKKLLMTLIISVMLHSVVISQSHRKTQTKIEVKPKVTFIELGSVNCIPCKQMQPVMKSVEEKYGTQVKVVFYDVWKEDQKQFATKYGIKLIPTQVFLDENGKEFFRHEGFYPETEINKLLQKKELKSIKKKE